MKPDREIELEVGLGEAIKLIDWFESWLKNRDEPVRYNPIDMQKEPPAFTVNYDDGGVAKIRTFLKAILDDTEGEYPPGDM